MIMARKKKTEPAVPPPGQTPEAPQAPGARAKVPPAEPGEGQSPGVTVVGIGASAGGLEALTEFFQAVPARSGLAFSVVPHLDPEHRSALVEILAEGTPMPVREVEDGMGVEPDCIYVLPPNRARKQSSTSEGGRLRMHEGRPQATHST
jgi:two-component system CheB/CheR fusion protein